MGLGARSPPRASLECFGRTLGLSDYSAVVIRLVAKRWKPTNRREYKKDFPKRQLPTNHLICTTSVRLRP